MRKWLLVFMLGALAHFGASYLVPLAKEDQGALGGVLRWVWPWGVGDRGPLGEMASTGVPFGGLMIAMATAGLSILAALAVLGIWVPKGWWRTLAITGAVLELALMVLFFGPTKLLAIALGLVVLWASAVASEWFEIG